MKKANVGIVGATGMVGRTFLKVLEERNFPIDNLYLFSSKKSAGSKVEFMGKEYVVEELTEDNIKNKKIDFALFSAGGDVSKEYAPVFARYGAVVIDNSSAWRMDPEIPLVVPEVNPEDIKWNKGIIANPNCSTIQAMVALKPLQDKYGIKRIIYSTYQAVSGAGVGGYNDLYEGYKGNAPKKFPYPIAGNLLPHIDVFLENGYTKEEMKMVDETKKILHDDNLKITATTVRVPVAYGHSESINVELEKEFELADIFELYKNADGVVLKDDVKNLVYPMPIDAAGHDEVFVGRIRRDFSSDNALNLWVVADNIRKGAASNAVQIAEVLLKDL
ncbi:aspartate-semialdehyde dehydrogenase [Clostridium magnum]|uniref:Aspartate-semialdehyde dehydrogenase n=1 Tax=Clostridium magnum DSM 2767 TaxID=1121326 RepID=A0A162SM73_9CLOT|nr:aspartate-semialdehyde dehydrogenase [Clostridium magnum]KZL91603.1 aspartate-semialdehyde dehydrogenase [Clostridium magnum DSM 2767]SHH49190.1 aspartate-semialdehyde dehydrogenase [Clostridium magnum DSM 2767]